MSRIDDFYKIDLLHNGDFRAAPNGDFALSKGLDNLKQALNNRLLTVKGTLAHRPDYGVGIKTYKSAIASLTKKRELAKAIEQQFLRDERVTSLDGVAFDKEEQDGTFIIKYSITTAAGEGLEESFDPFGE